MMVKLKNFLINLHYLERLEHGSVDLVNEKDGHEKFQN